LGAQLCEEDARVTDVPPPPSKAPILFYLLLFVAGAVMAVLGFIVYGWMVFS
jgi:hypothetical protein